MEQSSVSLATRKINKELRFHSTLFRMIIWQWRQTNIHRDAGVRRRKEPCIMVGMWICTINVAVFWETKNTNTIWWSRYTTSEYTTEVKECTIAIYVYKCSLQGCLYYLT